APMPSLPPLLLPLPARGRSAVTSADAAGGIVRALLAGQAPSPVAAVVGTELGLAVYQVPSLRRPREQYTVIVAASPAPGRAPRREWRCSCTPGSAVADRDALASCRHRALVYCFSLSERQRQVWAASDGELAAAWAYWQVRQAQGVA